MAVATKRIPRRHQPYARMLQSKREELRSHLRDHRQEVLVEQIPEDEGSLASRNLLEDLAIGTLQREHELLREVEWALERLEQNEFAVCEGCGAEIPEPRLRALPWARFCVPCAEGRQAYLKN